MISINNNLRPSQFSLFVSVHYVVLVNIWFLFNSLDLLSLSNDNTILIFQTWIELVWWFRLFEFQIFLLNWSRDFIIWLRKLLICTWFRADLPSTLILFGDLLRILIVVITYICIGIIHRFEILLLECSTVIIEDDHFCGIRWRIWGISVLLSHVCCPSNLAISFNTVTLIFERLFFTYSFGRTCATNTLLTGGLH